MQVTKSIQHLKLDHPRGPCNGSYLVSKAINQVLFQMRIQSDHGLSLDKNICNDRELPVLVSGNV